MSWSASSVVSRTIESISPDRVPQVDLQLERSYARTPHMPAGEPHLLALAALLTWLVGIQAELILLELALEQHLELRLPRLLTSCLRKGHGSVSLLPRFFWHKQTRIHCIF